MSIRTIRCEECGETRSGRHRDGETRPVREECPACGSTAFVDVVDERG